MSKVHRLLDTLKAKFDSKARNRQVVIEDDNFAELQAKFNAMFAERLARLTDGAETIAHQKKIIACLAQCRTPAGNLAHAFNFSHDGERISWCKEHGIEVFAFGVDPLSGPPGLYVMYGFYILILALGDPRAVEFELRFGGEA